MPWGAIAAAVAPSVIGGLLGGSGGGGQTAGGVNPATQMPNQGTMANDLYNANVGYMPTAQQYYGMQPGYANAAFSTMYNNPYAAGMQNAGVQAGQMAGQMAPAAMQAGQGTMAAAQQVLNTAFDPQNALYNQMQNQVQQQSNATNSQYGLGSSGAGAGVANQNMQNFDINWQNQQLARQQQGLQSYNAANQAGLGLMGTGVNAAQQAGALPYNTAQGIGAGQFGAISAEQAAMQGGLQPYQQNINNMSSYLGLGQSAQAQANAQAAQQQLLQQQNVMGGAQFGAYLGQQPGVQSAISGLFGGGNVGSNASMAALASSPTTSSMDNLGISWADIASDRRLKDNIERIGETVYGLGKYVFSYISDSTKKRYIGVMADEVKKVMPEAVVRVNGYDHVRYGMLGIQMEEV